MEVTPTKDIVFQLSLPPGTISYRAYKFDVPILDVIKPYSADPAFEIRSIYPNPAQSRTTVDFYSNEEGITEIELIDVLGNIRYSSTQHIKNAGIYSFNVDLKDIPSGVYYCKLSQNGFLSIKTIIITR
jgi:hypothetical protein